MVTNDYAGHRLRHLKGSDFEVADGQPDIRGWKVKDVNDKRIGEVDDLIFDEQTLKVRYMVVDLDHNDFDIDDDHDVLIPIGLGEIPEKHKEIIIPNISATQITSLPVYDEDKTILPEDEYKIRSVFGAPAVGTAAGVITDDFYNHEYYDQDNLHRRRNTAYNADTKDYPADTAYRNNTDAPVNTTDTNVDRTAPVKTDTTNIDRDRDRASTANTNVNTNDTYTDDVIGNDRGTTTIPVIEERVDIGKQTVKTGGAYLKARIVEKPVEESVNLKEEHINIDRRPVDRPANDTDFDTFKEGVIEMEERAEVPVVNKEARVVEEINVNKEVSERTETVRDTVRKTEVDIENLGDRRDNRKDNV